MDPNLLKLQRFISNNSPSILTVLGVTGTLTAVYLTGVASFKAAKLLQDDPGCNCYPNETEPMDFQSKFNLVWKLYIPPALTTALAISCFVASNQIGNGRAAALATAYSLSEKAIAEYRGKVVEKIGESKERNIRDEVAQDQVSKNTSTIISGSGDVLCYDSFTDRYFTSNMETLRKAQNDLNFTILQEGNASLSDLYDKIGLPHTVFSDEVGWRDYSQIELLFSTVLSPDGKPCLSVNFRVEPIRNYFRIN